MYLFIVIALMLALPLISIVAQIILNDHVRLHGAWYLLIVAKWYVFWAVGVRLSLAGLRQIIQPRYTAETILGLKGAEALFFVRELGVCQRGDGQCRNRVRRVRARYLLLCLTAMVTLSDSGSKRILASPRLSCLITRATLSSSDNSF